MAQDKGATILKNTVFALEVAFDSEIDKRTMAVITAKAHDLITLQSVAVKRIMAKQPEFFEAYTNFSDADILLCTTSCCRSKCVPGLRRAQASLTLNTSVLSRR